MRNYWIKYIRLTETRVIFHSLFCSMIKQFLNVLVVL